MTNKIIFTTTSTILTINVNEYCSVTINIKSNIIFKIDIVLNIKNSFPMVDSLVIIYLNY